MDQESLYNIYNYINFFLLFYFALINIIYSLALFFGIINTFTRRKEESVEDYSTILSSDSLPAFSFIIPEYNESNKVINTIQNILNLSYRYKEIIVINDGSQDNSLQMMIDAFNLLKIPKLYSDTLPTKPIKQLYQSKSYPSFRLIDKENGKKFDAMNAGLNACSTSFFIVVDADTLIDDIGFETLIRPILSSPQTAGVGASVRILAGATLEFNRIPTAKVPNQYLSAMQCLEYIRSFAMRQGWNWLGGNTVISGAFSIYRKDLILKVGGYSPTVAEDMEMVLRVRHILNDAHTPYKLFYLPDPVAWTEGPCTLKELGKQRSAWHRGLIESLWYHKKMTLNPKYGVFGLFTFPFWIWGEAFEPVVEVFGIFLIIVSALFHFLNVQFFILWVLGIYGFTTLFTIATVLLEEFSYKKYSSIKSLIKLFLYCFIEGFMYRQLILYWRCRGGVDFFKRFKEVQNEAALVRDLIKKSQKMGPLL